MNRIILIILLPLRIILVAEDKFALVIGNSNYSKDPLSNTINDANDVSKVFSDLGYNVTKIIDGNKQSMELAVSKVSKSLTEDSMLVFYYAGHAAQVDKNNYLIPVNENISDENDLKYKSVNLEWILGSFKSSQSRTNIIILDSCRDNPFKNSTRGGGTRGLTVIPSSPSSGGNFKNTAIIYATTDGNTADDGNGRNSPFTTAFLEHVAKDDETVLDVMLYVTQDVYINSDGKQEPTMTNALKEKVYFKTKGYKLVPTYGSLLLSFKTDGEYYLDGEYIGTAKKGEDKLISGIDAVSHMLTFTTSTDTEEIKAEVLKNTIIPVVFKLENNEEVRKELLQKLNRQLLSLNEKSDELYKRKEELKQEVNLLDKNLKLHNVGKSKRDSSFSISKNALIISSLSYASAIGCGLFVNENYNSYQSSETESDATKYRENATNFIIATASTAALGLITSYITGSKYKEVKEFDLVTNMFVSEVKFKRELLSEVIVSERKIDSDIKNVSLKIESL